MERPIGVARRVLEAKIEELIALLDFIDGDIDLEPGNDNEPSLGWPEGWPGQGAARVRNIMEDDRELEDENDEAETLEGNGDEDDEDEPSLGINGGFRIPRPQ